MQYDYVKYQNTGIPLKKFYVFWKTRVMDVIPQAARAVHPVHTPLSRTHILPGDINITVSNDSNNWAGYATNEIFQSFIYRKLNFLLSF